MSKRNLIGGQFSARTIEMLNSPAYRVLSLTARRVLDRIEIEHARHGGRDNGSLAITFDQFEKYGARRHSIASALRELAQLGFIEVTEQGRAGNAEWRRPTLFRLTYRDTADAAATDEWRSISEDDANTFAKGSRQPENTPPNFSVSKPHHKKQKPSVRNATIGRCRNATTGRCRNDTEPPKILGAETALLSRYSPSTAPKVPHTPNPQQCPRAGLGPCRADAKPSPDPDPEAADAWADLGIPPFLRRGSR
jgi:hypothetical protein